MGRPIQGFRLDPVMPRLSTARIDDRDDSCCRKGLLYALAEGYEGDITYWTNLGLNGLIDYL
jgi:hypothetical protein